METLLINEQFVSQFKYWREEQLRTEMRFRNHLFEHIDAFAYHQRHQVFELAEQLAESGKGVIVTVSPNQYTIWVNLRTVANSSSFNRRSPEPIQITRIPSRELILLKAAMSA